MSKYKFKAGHIMAVVFPPADVGEEKAPEVLANYLQGLLVGFPNAIGIIHEPEPTLNQEQEKKHHLHLIVYGDVMNGDLWIEAIVSMIHCDPLQVSVEAISNDPGALRYLVHMDNKEKKAYSIEAVQYRNASMFAEFKKAVSSRSDFTIDEIIACTSYEAVARLVGWKNYANAIRIYRDINEERLQQHKLDAEISEFYERQAKASELLKEFLDENKFLNPSQMAKLQRIQRILILGVFDDEKD